MIRSGLHWPAGIACGLLIVVLVNGLLTYFAVSGAPEVVPSYERQNR